MTGDCSWNGRLLETTEVNFGIMDGFRPHRLHRLHRSSLGFKSQSGLQVESSGSRIPETARSRAGYRSVSRGEGRFGSGLVHRGVCLLLSLVR